MTRTDFGGTEYGTAMVLQRDGILVAGYRSGRVTTTTSCSPGTCHDPDAATFRDAES
jgi:hypothetical protein